MSGSAAHHAAHQGVLIAVEGADGAGTSTQCRRLVDWLGARGRETHLTREPSDGPVGALIREVLGGAHAPFDRRSLALLFAADRVDHLRREIEPALGRGQVVVSDRYVLSSLVYQSLEADREFVAVINRHARQPDLTLVVEVSGEVAAERRRGRGGSEEIFDDTATQEQVIAGYRAEAERAALAGGRVRRIDGTGDADTVFRLLQEVVAAELETLPAVEARP